MQIIIKFISIIIIGALLISACSKDDDSNVDCSDLTKNILGEWNFEMNLSGSPKNAKANFKGDGTLTLVPKIFFGTGMLTYEVLEDSLNKELVIIETYQNGGSNLIQLVLKTIECDTIYFGDFTADYFLLTK